MCLLVLYFIFYIVLGSWKKLDIQTHFNECIDYFFLWEDHYEETPINVYYNNTIIIFL